MHVASRKRGLTQNRSTRDRFLIPPLRMLAEPESGLADVVAKCLLQRAKDACDLADRELDSNLEYEVMSGSPNPAKLLYLYLCT